MAIKIIKIQEDGRLDHGQKLHQLIRLLSIELELDDFGISGEEIVNGNPEHIHRFLEILYEYSKIYMKSRKRTNAVKSVPEKNKMMKEKEKPVIRRRSARESRRADHDEDEEE
jgi:nitroreductase